MLPFALTFLAHAHLWGGRLAHAEADAGRGAARAATPAWRTALVRDRRAAREWRPGAGTRRAAARWPTAPARSPGSVAWCSPRAPRRPPWRSSSSPPGRPQPHSTGWSGSCTAPAPIPRIASRACRPSSRPRPAPATRGSARGRTPRRFGEWAPGERDQAWAATAGGPLPGRMTAATPGGGGAATSSRRVRLHHAPLQAARPGAGPSSCTASSCGAERRKAEARPLLRSALEDLGGTPASPLWAERARDRAAGGRGERASAAGTRALERLTPQELQVARLVAQGAEQPRGGGRAVPQPADRRVPPAQGLPQAGRARARRVAALVTRDRDRVNSPNSGAHTLAPDAPPVATVAARLRARRPSGRARANHERDPPVWSRSRKRASPAADWVDERTSLSGAAPAG